MVEGVVGLMGQGKTYYTVVRALEALRAGRTVVANFPIEGCYLAETWSDFLRVRDGLIIMDEANLLFPSRFWAKLDPRLLYYWSQSRKLGLDILWTAQHERRVDTALREITYQVWLARRIGRAFMYRAYLPEDVRKAKVHVLGRRMMWRKDEVCSSYDTMALIDLSREVDDRGELPDYRGAESLTLVENVIHGVARIKTR